VPGRRTGELAFLRVAYKLPGQRRSQEIGRPITPADVHAGLDSAPREARFGAAVAGFAQLLRRAPQLGDWSFADAAAMAAAARGEDADGRRAEFVSLVKLASQLDAVQLR
jgi:Ca-activated chloride channel family protein